MREGDMASIIRTQAHAHHHRDGAPFEHREECGTHTLWFSAKEAAPHVQKASSKAKGLEPLCPSPMLFLNLSKGGRSLVEAPLTRDENLV